MSVLRTPICGARHIVPLRSGVAARPAPSRLAPLTLLSQVHSGGKLLFTRNTGLAEIADLIRNKQLGPRDFNPRFMDTKYFRYGLAHEYGEIVIVMREEFFSTEKGRSRLNNIWLQDLNIGGRHLVGRHFEERTGLLYQEAEKVGPEEAEELLKELAGKVKYNHYIPIKQYAPGQDYLPQDVGHTCVMGEEAAYSGNAPQLEVNQNIPISMVERILVPEHLAGEVRLLLTDQPDEIRDLFLLVEGSGQSEKDFLAGKENLRRRSRSGGGSYQPRFGDQAFHLFERAYYQLVINSVPLSYQQKMGSLAERFGFRPFNLREAWIDIYPSAEGIKREKDDWCIFLQPKAAEMAKVFAIVMQVLQGKGITLKVPADLERTWREGRTFGSPGSPKIKLYLNQETLKPVMLELAKALEAEGMRGDGVGPSFTRAYGKGGLLYYKKEHFSLDGPDLRAVIANRQGAAATQTEKGVALAAAGFSGENFYMRGGDLDPLEEPAAPPSAQLQKKIGENWQVQGKLKSLIAAAGSEKWSPDKIQRINDWTKRVMEDSPDPATKLLVRDLLVALRQQVQQG